MSDDEHSIVYGFHPVRELLRSRPQEVRELWLGGGRSGRRIEEILELARRHRLEVSRVAESQIDQRLGGSGTHNGMLAVAEKRTEQEEGSDPHLVVLLEDVQDPRNLGALLRVCEGAGVGRVLIRDRGSAPITPTVEKASAGAIEWLSIERITNSAQEMKRLQDDGFWIYGADGKGDAPWKHDLGGKVVLCLGGEERGLRDLTRKSCDALLGLPMRGRVESLNVATAAAGLLYEIVRQRSG